jgi:type I restriction enzyme R subunit
MNMNMDDDLSPEQKTRREIDKKLRECGWHIQNYRDFNPAQGLGIAIREYPTDTGPVDYALFVDRNPVGVIEAKKDGEVLSNHEEQTEEYAKSKFKWQINEEPLPFVYEATSKEVRFTDLRDPRPRFRELFSFHRPETVLEWSKEPKPLRARFQDLPALDTTGLRDCQIVAINNLEASLKDNRPRALVQMATGSGKTYTAITSMYRLLKFAKAKRVLFLVDTTNLGKQAEQEMQAFKPQDDQNIFTNIYTVQRLNSSFVDPNAQVCISTIQRMYSILKGVELDEQNEEIASEQGTLPSGENATITYNDKLPVESFDLIIIDECHRSIYNLWKQVLDYFDTSLVGLTATPDARTFGFFNKNVVSEYGYEDAVADGVNVPYDVYTIETEITSKGAEIKAGEYVDKRSRLTREKRWEQLDEELEYRGNELDRGVVSEDQIRTVLATFRDKLKSEIFPERGDEVPKTLIFAKTDSHSDDIIRIAREVFGQGNDFIRKVTYNETNASQFLADFRTSYYPRIAVTVDMIATGTDVKPIECLIFMRNIKSRNYFEQMIGRGTRTLGEDDLKRVTPTAKTNKTHFVIIDAVGVFNTLKSDSRPLERKKSTSLKDLMMETVMGNHGEDNLTSLANRLTRLDKELTTQEQSRIQEQTAGTPLKDLVKQLFEALNPDKYLEKARAMFGKSNDDAVTEQETEAAKQELVKSAVQPFDNHELRETILRIREEHDQIIDSVNLDTVTRVGYDPDSKERALKDIKRFKDFLDENKDKIDALQIFYNQPYQRRALTFEMIKDLVEKLKYPPYSLNTDRVWRAYEITEQDKVRGNAKALMDAVSLVRHGIGLDDLLVPFADVVEERYQSWLNKLEAEGKTFTPEQRAWLDMMKSHIANSLAIDKGSFDHTPFVEHGGLFEAHKLFDGQFEDILTSLNRELVEV